MFEDFRLKVFMSVAGNASFTKAAAELNVSQPAVSQNIAELEKAVGTALFERRRGETVLTDEGRVFMDYAVKILESCSRTGEMFSRVAPAKVRISVSEELYENLVGPAIDAFSKVHPDVSFERCIYGDADLHIFLRKSSGLLNLMPEDAVARARVSLSFPSDEKTGDLSATREVTSCYDVVFRPSEAFSCTKLCRLLRECLIF